MQRAIFLLTMSCSLLATPARGLAQNWARQMFESTSHNFGTVALAAKTEYVFEFTNTQRQDVHIRGVRVSCGCTTPKVETYTVKPGEQGAVRAILNTRSFKGSVKATITVVFDRPYYSEVQLQVWGYVRRDVVFNPSCADFGSVAQGSSAERHVDLQYAGRSDWQIKAIRSPEPSVTVRATQTRRAAGRVGYDLAVRLADDAPPGYLNTEITLETNDFRMQTVPLTVSAHIVPALTVSPSLLFLGNVKSDTTKSMRLVVRGSESFRVTGVECNDARFQFNIPEQAKTMHFIPLEFTAGPNPGPVKLQIRIETDLLGGKTAEITASGTVVP